MTFGYVAAKHIADQVPESAITSGAQPDSTLDSHRKVTK
jgi:3-oxosteroid 1-dehydrogenase